MRECPHYQEEWHQPNKGGVASLEFLLAASIKVVVMGLFSFQLAVFTEPKRHRGSQLKQWKHQESESISLPEYSPYSIIHLSSLSESFIHNWWLVVPLFTGSRPANSMRLWCHGDDFFAFILCFVRSAGTDDHRAVSVWSLPLAFSFDSGRRQPIWPAYTAHCFVLSIFDIPIPGFSQSRSQSGAVVLRLVDVAFPFLYDTFRTVYSVAQSLTSYLDSFSSCVSGNRCLLKARRTRSGTKEKDRSDSLSLLRNGLKENKAWPKAKRGCFAWK